jgi:hypothetical protein
MPSTSSVIVHHFSAAARFSTGLPAVPDVEHQHLDGLQPTGISAGSVVALVRHGRHPLSDVWL